MTASYSDALNEAIETKKLSAEAAANIHLWISDEAYASYREQIISLIDAKKWSELDDSFYSRVRVGTGGIRGPLGPGPNRINTRTIGEAAQALANFIQGFGPEAVAQGIVVGHEVRKSSREFAEMCCEVFAANGIKSYLFDHFRATPELSFAVRHLGVTAAVQLTASHNPRTDNGFKFYWSDGGQVVPPLDLKFMSLVSSVDEIKRLDLKTATEQGLVELVGEQVDQAYYQEVLKQSVTSSHSATITFSPIHGAGSTNVLPVLKAAGFDVQTVPEQADPDGNFPTAHGDLINPEFLEVMKMPIELAAVNNSDLALMSDPDADRLGVAVKESFSSSTMVKLSGNEVGIALTHYILKNLRDTDRLHSDNLVVTTYVTSSLIGKIARSFSIKVTDDLLVGFKFIGEIITNLDNPDDFIFAAEESLGYLRGSYARDKDASVAALLVAGLASELKDEQKTIIDYLDDIYRQYGYFKNLLLPSILGEGRVGKQRIVDVMQGLRAQPPSMIAGREVVQVIDLLPEDQRQPENYKAAATGDQLTFILNDDNMTRLTARPSGTEPIIKYYTQVWQQVSGDLDATKQVVDAAALEIQNDLNNYANQFIVDK